jgi:hypothetical protein
LHQHRSAQCNALQHRVDDDAQQQVQQVRHFGPGQDGTRLVAELL